MFDSTRRRVLTALGLGGAASLAGCVSSPDNEPENPTTAASQSPNAAQETSGLDIDQIAADPTGVPAPITRSTSEHHEITLETEELTAEIEPGVSFDFMTFGGQIPGPMIRVRQGDTISLRLENFEENTAPHNVDLHAVYGTGGGAIATTAAPGEENAMEFEAMYPGAYIYHCAVPNLDYHISSGMFGMILVEPEGGLPEVDHEFYFGQHELYTDAAAGKEGKHGFDFDAMKAENPTYVLLNGEKYAYTANKHGPLQVEKGDTARVYMVTGGPNLPSYFHPIGNVWTKAWPNGAIASTPDEYVQTMTVAPGSCFIGELEFPVPSRVKLVDHALSRVANKGMMAEIDVVGGKESGLFDPSPGTEDDEGPIYGQDGGD